MTIRHTKHTGSPGRPKERGAAMVLVTIAMLVLILMGGLALDVGHMMVNKARLQNAVDAAALSAAKTLDETSSTSLATGAAYQALGLDANDPGNQELATSYNGGSIDVVVQYSSTLPPFNPGSPTGPYVRVIATGFVFPTWLADVGGIMQLHVNASAVAGPSPTINTACNVAPLLACGLDPTTNPDYGYTNDAPQLLKSSAPGSSAVGPGNFQLIQLGGTGANLVRQNLAGDYNSCPTVGNSVQTETGNETGPVAQGLNTRFGIYTGTMTSSQYPPDVITTYGSSPQLTVNSSDQILQGTTLITSSNVNSTPGLYSYDHYRTDEGAGAKPPWTYLPVSMGGIGEFNRRMLAIPVGNCQPTANGSTSVQIYGLACFYIIQPVTQQGTTDYIIGQFESNCQVDGDPGPSPGAGYGPHIIELYHDPGSPDS